MKKEEKFMKKEEKFMKKEVKRKITKKQMLHCYIHVELSHDLISESSLYALDLRHAMENEIEQAGLEVCGAGLGCGGMDIHLMLELKNKEYCEKLVNKIIKQYGFKNYKIEFENDTCI